MKLKIESTETGEVFNARLESSIDKLKNQVSLVTRIPIQDQILLIGPPYKILDTQYGPNLNVEDKRIFVFNRKILSSETQEFQRVKLLPFEVSKPLNEFNHLPSTLSQTVSPSAQYLLEFEKYFQEQLMRGQCYETFIVEVYKSCRESVARHQVQLDGVDAAINNLKDTYQAIKKPFDTLEKRLVTQQAKHFTLLSEFEENLEKLRSVTLHPSLIAAIEKQKAEVGLTGSTLDGNTALVEVPITTLYDCIPVERERVYHQQSLDSFQKVDDQVKRVRSNYESVSTGVSVLTIPVVDFGRLGQLLGQLSSEVDSVTAMVAEMKKNYQFVYDTITSATATGGAAAAGSEGNSSSVSSSGTNNTGDAAGAAVAAPAAVHNLTTSSLTSALQSASNAATLDLETLVSDMARRKFNQERQQYFVTLDQKTASVKGFKQEIEDSQNQLIVGIYAVMRSIAQLQTDIQYRLKKDVDWMKKMTNGSNEYFKHLEHLTALPTAYDNLLQEIVRRKAYNGVFTGEVTKAYEKISQFRTDEIKEREVFMTTYGLCLPPVFFKIIPTLKDKPPYFQPNITEDQWLPDVHYEDLDRQRFLGMMHEMSSPSRDGRSNYIYSDQQQLQHLSRVNAAAAAPSSTSFPLSLNFSDASRITDTLATQSQLDEFLAGGAQYRSNANSVMMVGRDEVPSTLTIQSHMTEVNNPAPSARGGTGVGGGSVILPAQTKEEGLDELQSKYDLQVYENSKLLRIIDEMRKQLTAANAHIEKQRGRTRTQSDAMDAAYATPPSESAVAPTLEVPSNVVPPTAAVVSTADATPVESTAVSAVMSPPPTHSQPQVTEAQNELIESFIESFRYIQSSLSEEASIGTQIQFLESHGYITGLPEVVKELRLLKGIIPAKEEESEGLRDLVSSVFTLISKMKQCLSHSLRNPVITFIDFQVGDIALFMPLSTENRKVWIAFNSNSPYHFLAETSMDRFLERSRDKENRKFILARIFFIETHTTTAEYAPFPIPPGTVFHICHGEPIKALAPKTGGTNGATATKAESSSSSATPAARIDNASDGPFSAPR